MGLSDTRQISCLLLTAFPGLIPGKCRLFVYLVIDACERVLGPEIICKENECALYYSINILF